MSLLDASDTFKLMNFLNIKDDQESVISANKD